MAPFWACMLLSMQPTRPPPIHSHTIPLTQYNLTEWGKPPYPVATGGSLGGSALGPHLAVLVFVRKLVCVCVIHGVIYPSAYKRRKMQVIACCAPRQVWSNTIAPWSNTITSVLNNLLGALVLYTRNGNYRSSRMDLADFYRVSHPTNTGTYILSG